MVGKGLAARGGSLPSPKRAEPARLLRCSLVKYGKYSPSSRLASGPAAPISARSDFHLGLLGALALLLLSAGAPADAQSDDKLVRPLGETEVDWSAGTITAGGGPAA